MSPVYLQSDTEMTPAEWSDAVCDLIESTAEAHGWSGIYTRESRRNWQLAQTGSRYTTLSRSWEHVDEDGDTIEESEEVTVRVSDHGSCYCREDWSIVRGGGSGDDHKIEALLEHFARRVVA